MFELIGKNAMPEKVKMSELFGPHDTLTPPQPNRHHRAGDQADPLWGLLDMAPEGRGEFFPKANYD